MHNHKIATNNDESNCEERQLVDQSKNNEQQQEISRISDSILNATNLNEYDYYNYPPNLEQAEIHRQAYYLCPDQYVLNNYPKEYCECCNKKFHRQPFNWVFGDLYEATVDEYGLAAPLYFTIIKFQLIIFIIVFCIYGVFFISEIHRICNSNPQLNCHIENNDLCRTCEFQYSYGFIDIVTIQEYLHQEKGSNYQWFQVSAFLIFLINLHLPFFYDLLITYISFKYWNRDPYNKQNETITSIYIRGMSSKLTEKEILNLIKESMQRNNNQIISSQNKLLDNAQIEEIVYIYNTQEIKSLQQKRQNCLLDLVITAQQIKELELSKEIITYKDTEVKVYKAYTKEFLSQRISDLMKQLSDVNDNINKQIIGLQINNIPMNNQDINKMKLEPLEFSQKAIIRFNDPNISQLILQNFQISWFNKLRIKLNLIPNPKLIDKLIVKKSFRINGLYWENIGFRSQERIAAKVKSAITMLIACAALMTAYEFIYLYKNDPEYKVEKNNGRLSVAQRVLTNIFTVAVPIITTVAILVVIINQKESKKNTFAHLERSFMHVLIVVNYFLVTFLPYIFTFELWSGKTMSAAVYDLVTLTQNKIITKHVFHTVHIRYMGFVFLRRRIQKNCKEYFQGQLNNLMTPPTFPQRSRVCNAMYSLTVGLCLVYVCPVITIISFIFNCYIYLFDRYSITHLYSIDKKFTISLMRHQLKIYSLSFFPIKIYLFIKLFWRYGWLIYAGVPTCCAFTIISILFREKIVYFLLTKVFRVSRREDSKHTPETYTSNYYQYMKKLNIDEQNEITRKILNSQGCEIV
ncbi:unnamed protein product [Paramecium pentaurelia]|uniref:Uncharacterized protein n=1 Tax=Paramecium pentaurelia TaxID=43138 RepID=A0A8S1U0L0_9CILI|nr:unnamed protein product [Paramecium pentaurelia]